MCRFCADATLLINYKDSRQLRYFITERGKIIPRRISGTVKASEEITLAVKNGTTPGVDALYEHGDLA